MKEWSLNNYEWKKGVELFIGKRIQLIEIQSIYAAFLTSFFEYTRFMELDYLRVQSKQLNGRHLYLQMANREFNLIEKNTRLAHSMYKRDSTLYMSNAMISPNSKSRKANIYRIFVPKRMHK